MKFIIAMAVLIGLSLGIWELFQFWEGHQEEPRPATAPAQVEISGEQLPGLPSSLEGPLRTAEEQGAPALRQFLNDHGNMIKDPRRAWIDLDYVVLAGATDPAEARRVFSKVQTRLTPSSPVYARMKELEKTYQ
jgi:hypothetical protein